MESFREILLNKTDFFLEMVFDRRDLEMIDYHVRDDPYTGAVILSLKRGFYTEKKTVEEIVTFETYESWWDYFKHINFPKWLLTKFPPKMKIIKKKVSFDRNFLFPDAYIKGSPQLGKFIPMDTNFNIQNIES